MPHNTQDAINNLRNNNKPQMRKRHWALGLGVILGGSWITHSTTATIASPESLQPPYSEPAVLENTDLEQFTLSNIENNEASVKLSTSAESISIPDVKVTTHETDIVKNKIEPKAPEVFTTEFHKVKKGESLGIIFRKKSLDMSLPHYIAQHEVASQLVSLSIGKKIEFKYDQSKQLRAIHYPTSALEQLVIKLDNSSISDAYIEELNYQTHKKHVSATINSSLFLSASEAGLSHNLIMEMIRIFGWDVDFAQDIRRNDSFHVIYEEHHLNQTKLSDGKILAAEFTTQGQTYRAIRFENEDGSASYFTPEGESMLGTFLRSPVEFSRISSRFGRRKHPISKKWKAHKGVDYAAARGTPIRATADGRVKSAGRNGGYGNTVVLTHAGRFSTLYAHMKGFAKGIRSGSRVKQGQIIGYVGSTGYSTGPHLHYEFRVDGVHRNSLTYKTPKASSVAAENKEEFEVLVAKREQELNKVQRDYQLAQLSAQGSEN